MLLSGGMALANLVGMFLLRRYCTYSLALLRALAQKLIPGIPLNTRIALLQQTAEVDGITSDKTVLQQVVRGDPYRNTVLREVEGGLCQHGGTID